MPRPSVKTVSNWFVTYKSELVEVACGEPEQAFYRVVIKGQRPKYFYGEMAWADSRRMASDADFGAWSIP
jgi:hypothetical protein